MINSRTLLAILVLTLFASFVILIHLGYASDLSETLFLTEQERNRSSFPDFVDETVLAYHSLWEIPSIAGPLSLGLSSSAATSFSIKRAVFYTLMVISRENHELVESYLHRVHLGKTKGIPIIGFPEAAPTYFGVSHARLTVGETTLLSHLAISPSAGSPLSHPDESLKVRERLLTRLRNAGFLSPGEFKVESDRPLSLASDHIPIN